MTVELTGPLVAVLCTISLLIGVLTGMRDRRVDRAIYDAEEWTQHLHSALWVSRRTLPEQDDTVAR